MHLLAGCGQWLHNACQHTLPGSGTSEGCQPPGVLLQQCSSSQQHLAPLLPSSTHPACILAPPHSPHTGLGPALLQGVLLGCRWTGCNTRDLPAPLLWDRCSLMWGTWFSCRDMALSGNLAQARPSSPCLPLSLSIPGNEMLLLTKPNRTARYITIIPAASRSSEGSLWCSSEN